MNLWSICATSNENRKKEKERPHTVKGMNGSTFARSSSNRIHRTNTLD